MGHRHEFDEVEALARENPGLIKFADGVAPEWIPKAEGALGVRLPPSFVHFLLQYGGATIGHEEVNGLLGLEFADACGPDVVYNTLLDRKSGLDPYLLPLVDNDGDEIFYLDTSVADADGENPVVRVMCEAPETREAYAPSFVQFLLERIRFCLAAHR